MNPFAWTVRVRAGAQQALTAHARNHAFPIGDPFSFRPMDDLPSSLELMLGAFAADLIGTFRSLAEKQRLTLDALECAVTCTLNNPLIHVGVIGETGHPRHRAHRGDSLCRRPNTKHQTPEQKGDQTACTA